MGSWVPKGVVGSQKGYLGPNRGTWVPIGVSQKGCFKRGTWVPKWEVGSGKGCLGSNRGTWVPIGALQKGYFKRSTSKGYFKSASLKGYVIGSKEVLGSQKGYLKRDPVLQKEYSTSYTCDKWINILSP